MAIYVPRARRRRQLVLLTLAGLVVGAVLGVLVGRLTAPTVAERVAAVQQQASQVTAQLRVLSLHAEAGAVSVGVPGEGGAELALRRADADLGKALDEAVWIPVGQRNGLRRRLEDLERGAGDDAARPAFGAAVDRLANDVDQAFGVRG